MPKSRKRKKQGKKVGNGERSRFDRMQDHPSGVTMQDLINMVAYQKYQAEGAYGEDAVEIPDMKVVDDEGEPLDMTYTKFADDATVHIPDEVPVVVGEGENKRQVGTASAVPGTEGEFSVHITDPEMATQLNATMTGDFSIEENQEQD